MSEKTVYIFTILENGNIESITSITNEDVLDEKIQKFLKKYNFSSHNEYLQKIETDPSTKYIIQKLSAGRPDNSPSTFSTTIRDTSNPVKFDVLEKEASPQKKNLPKKQIQSTLF